MYATRPCCAFLLTMEVESPVPPRRWIDYDLHSDVSCPGVVFKVPNFRSIKKLFVEEKEEEKKMNRAVVN